MQHRPLPEPEFEAPQTYLHQILDWLEEHIDLDHIQRLEMRHQRALTYQPVDRPPITIAGPVLPPLRIYPFNEVFADPVKMFVNELVGPYAALGSSPSVVRSVIMQDDYPLQIRAFYGVGLFVSLFGAESEVVGDNFPWVRPSGLEAVKKVMSKGAPPVDSPLVRRALETMALYRETLAAYPKCQRAIRITQPDLQGPFDSAEQLVGSDIFTLTYDDPAFVTELLDLIAETWAAASRTFSAASTERVAEGFIALHFTMSRGKVLLKDDTSVMLSPSTYNQFSRAANEKVLQALGGGGIHWCGTGDQWQAEVLATGSLLCLDWGQPHMIDLPRWAPLLREKRLPVSQMAWETPDFLASDVLRHFPTGATMTVFAETEEAVSQLTQLL
jgi:hypothetical protein